MNDFDLKKFLTENKLTTNSRILDEESPDLKQASEIARELKEKNCQWDLSQPGIKIFFDVTSFNHELQKFFGKLIIIGNVISKALKGQFKNSTASVNHVGFIFSDGSIFHATNDNVGVQFVNNFDEIVSLISFFYKKVEIKFSYPFYNKYLSFYSNIKFSKPNKKNIMKYKKIKN